MPIRMGVNPEQLKTPKPIPGGWYKLRMKGMVCKMSASKKGYNYEAFLNTVDGKAEQNDAFVLFRMNNGFSQAVHAQDFCHALGFPLEADGSFPGDWELKDLTKPDDFDKAQYKGVLLGKTVEAELITETYDGRESNVIKQFRCKIQDCNTRYPEVRHLTDLRGKKK